MSMVQAKSGLSSVKKHRLGLNSESPGFTYQGSHIQPCRTGEPGTCETDEKTISSADFSNLRIDFSQIFTDLQLEKIRENFSRNFARLHKRVARLFCEYGDNDNGDRFLV